MPSSSSTFTPRSSTTGMTPVSPMDKCMSRKRQRASLPQQLASEDDHELLSSSNGCTSEEGEFESDDDELLCVSTTSKCARMSMAQEVSGLQTAVRQMEKQVAQTSASIQELRSLVHLLVAQRQRQQQQQHAPTQCA